MSALKPQRVGAVSRDAAASPRWSPRSVYNIGTFYARMTLRMRFGLRVQFRFARNLMRKKSTSRTFNSIFEGYVDSRNLHNPRRECSLRKRCSPITQTSIYYVWTVTPCS